MKGTEVTGTGLEPSSDTSWKREPGRSVSKPCLPPPHSGNDSRNNWVQVLWGGGQHSVYKAGPLYENNPLQSLLKGGKVGIDATWGFPDELRAELLGSAPPCPRVCQCVKELVF